MKRRYRDLQKQALDVVRDAIDGGLSNTERLERLCLLMQKGLPSWDLAQYTARYVDSASKQTLRRLGEIEIVEGNVPKRVDELTRRDKEFIVKGRRQPKLAGQLKSNVEFCHSAGMFEEAGQFARALEAIATMESSESCEAEQYEEDLSFGFVA